MSRDKCSFVADDLLRWAKLLGALEETRNFARESRDTKLEAQLQDNIKDVKQRVDKHIAEYGECVSSKEVLQVSMGPMPKDTGVPDQKPYRPTSAFIDEYYEAIITSKHLEHQGNLPNLDFYKKIDITDPTSEGNRRIYQELVGLTVIPSARDPDFLDFMKGVVANMPWLDETYELAKKRRFDKMGDFPKYR